MQVHVHLHAHQDTIDYLQFNNLEVEGTHEAAGIVRRDTAELVPAPRRVGARRGTAHQADVTADDQQQCMTQHLRKETKISGCVQHESQCDFFTALAGRADGTHEADVGADDHLLRRLWSWHRAQNTDRVRSSSRREARGHSDGGRHGENREALARAAEARVAGTGCHTEGGPHVDAAVNAQRLERGQKVRRDLCGVAVLSKL